MTKPEKKSEKPEKKHEKSKDKPKVPKNPRKNSEFNMEHKNHMSHSETPGTSKFNVGDHVNHSAAGGNVFPAGSGIVTEIILLKTGEFSYKVKCDSTGAIIPVLLMENELTQI